MSGAILTEEFFKKLKEKIDEFLDFFRKNWIWGAVFFFVLLLLIIFQQLILSFFLIY